MPRAPPPRPPPPRKAEASSASDSTKTKLRQATAERFMIGLQLFLRCGRGRRSCARFGYKLHLRDARRGLELEITGSGLGREVPIRQCRKEDGPAGQSAIGHDDAAGCCPVVVLKPQLPFKVVRGLDKEIMAAGDAIDRR